LTGANALNKVYGREVYTSNLQLGGTQIMHGNGVSHLVASNDLEGVVEIVKWLSFVPKEKNSSLPVLPSTDPVDRDIEVDIPKTAYDPRTLLQGCRSENGFWHGGFFDKDSFQETMSGWANSVIVGRARIGGIPVGVIVTESRTTENVEFADPSVETSHEQINVQAGQVWYPNSAFKTAQAIRDFNKGEQLPLMIFANWRGFSGGQSDMHKEVLKFGAHIVDALVDFKQPIFVYIIGELRGGAWVVLDPTINPQMMEIYSEEEGRGGVIEPPGIVEIKFREKKIVATIERLDPVYRDLKEQLKANPKSDDLARRLEKRESELFPIFQQAAISFADLHDRPGRMLAKGVLKQVIQWRSARSFFYWRLLRRICESRVLHKIRSSDETIDFTAARSIMKSWFFNDVSSSAEKGSEGEKETIFDESDMDVVRWINNQKMDIEERISDLRAQRLTNLVKSIYMQSPSSVIDTFIAALGDMDEAAREKVKKAMQ
jgi:acetyl-CoA carboxylase/biotin carboxylase 1